jgi:predicted nucleic acid-binding protein
LDTGVLIALAAATGSWEVLNVLERQMAITPVVLDEVRRGAPDSPGVATPLPKCMQLWTQEQPAAPWLHNVLDPGEASVIALALERQWQEVAIDEAVGRSVAKTCQLRLTGSLGLLIRAKRMGYPGTLAEAISRIRSCGIWVGDKVRLAALKAAGESVE